MIIKSNRKNSKFIFSLEEKPAVVDIPAKLVDANKAAELIGKRYGMFKDSVKLDVQPVVIGGDDGLED